MTVTAPSVPTSPTDVTGKVLAEAARRMVPVLAGKLLTALADQGVARIERLADRLDDLREGAPAGEREPVPDEHDGSDDPGRASPSAPSGVVAFVMAQARALLDLVVRLVAQAAEMLRRATERLRARRAPEGIDEEDAIEGEFEEEFDDEDDDIADVEDEFVDEDEDEDEDEDGEFADDEDVDDVQAERVLA